MTPSYVPDRAARRGVEVDRRKTWEICVDVRSHVGDKPVPDVVMPMNAATAPEVSVLADLGDGVQMFGFGVAVTEEMSIEGGEVTRRLRIVPSRNGATLHRRVAPARVTVQDRPSSTSVTRSPTVRGV